MGERDRRYIAELNEGEKFYGFYLVVEKVLKYAKNDNPYLDILLQDRTGRIAAKLWEKAQEMDAEFDVGDIVGVAGAVEKFRDSIQIKIEKIRRIDEEKRIEENLTDSEFIVTTPKNIDEMWSEIWGIIKNIKNPYLSKLLSRIYRKYEKQLKSLPGSMRLHHAYQGGLLEHIFNTVKIAKSICKVYDEIDEELFIAGVLAHDIGKIRELSGKYVFDYTDEGNFIGHVVLGRDMLIEEAKEIEGFPELLRLKLEHIILSHHGKYEWQSPKEPAFPEAQLVYQIDEIDTRLYQMKNSIESDVSEGKWTSKSNYFKRVLYKGENPEKPLDNEDNETRGKEGKETKTDDKQTSLF